MANYHFQLLLYIVENLCILYIYNYILLAMPLVNEKKKMQNSDVGQSTILIQHPTSYDFQKYYLIFSKFGILWKRDNGQYSFNIWISPMLLDVDYYLNGQYELVKL